MVTHLEEMCSELYLIADWRRSKKSENRVSSNDMKLNLRGSKDVIVIERGTVTGTEKKTGIGTMIGTPAETVVIVKVTETITEMAETNITAVDRHSLTAAGMLDSCMSEVVTDGDSGGYFL